MDKIFVDNLKVDCIIGILDFERVKIQPLLISMELSHPLQECGKTGDLNLSINYAKLCQRVKEYVIQRKAMLLEELGVELCDLILKEFKPKAVKIKLNKPNAVADAQGVGIEMTKEMLEL